MAAMDASQANEETRGISHIQENGRVALFHFQYSHLLLFDGCIVAPYRPHGLQLGLLGHRPLGQLAEGEVEGVPVVGIVLQSISEKRIFVSRLSNLSL